MGEAFRTGGVETLTQAALLPCGVLGFPAVPAIRTPELGGAHQKQGLASWRVEQR